MTLMRSCGGMWVYPRVCGGSPCCLRGTAAATGLSPRVRGKPTEQVYQYRTPRSIPACAGEALGMQPRNAPNAVYPRVCGGSIPLNAGGPDCCGLSPRVRGKHPGGATRAVRLGSIPACAGEACTWTNRHRGRRVYPRVCGGSRNSGLVVPAYEGLSPRVRGKLEALDDLPHEGRSIPACAGEAVHCRG